MFRKVVASLLNKYLGRYIEGLGDNLEVSLKNGNLELTELRLRNDSLDDWELPIVLQSGTNIQIELNHISKILTCRIFANS